MKGEAMSIVHLTKKCVAFGADKSIIQLKPGDGAPSVKDVLLLSLRTPIEKDGKTGHVEKTRLFLLEKRIAPEAFAEGAEPVEKIELTETEVATFKQRVGDLFLSPAFVGRMCELLDGAE